MSIALWAGAGAIERSPELGSGHRPYRGADLAFGTTFTVQLLHDSKREARLAIEDAFRVARGVDHELSIYRAGSQSTT